MYSYPQYTGAHPVHNVDRMLGVFRDMAHPKPPAGYQGSQ